MIGQTVTHYRILEELGRGGMGIVYKAKDTRLKRTVALKFLPSELTRDKDAKARFIHEAQAASALQHNNICTIHEIDETPDGRLFICMDCYEGETLKQRIARGPLSIGEAIDIAGQLAEGLARAHEAKVIHRDIKPANIMLTSDGVLKILDFGLAKLAGRTKVTKTGKTVGTVSYMSPEQASGSDVDHRSDIFSVGVTLYELLTGRRPFRGDHDAAVLYGIMNTDPKPLSEHRPEIPADLELVVAKALAKDRSERYGSASDLVTDLKRFSTGGKVAGIERAKRHIGWRALPYVVIGLVIAIAGYVTIPRMFHTERVMLAVLPFENLGPAEDDYFADGITDEITARLASVHRLGVISRSSTSQYKDSEKTIREIGEELGVDYVIEGSVRWQRGDPSRIRVTPQLVTMADATQLWADVYEEILTEIFEVQSDIAKKVVSALNITLLEPESEMIESRPTNDLDAFDYYLRANNYFYQGLDRKLLLLSAQLYEQAVALDSSFVEAHAMLSRTYTELYWHHGRSDEYMTRAKRAADQALDRRPDLPGVRIALGSYYYHQEDYERALEEFTLAEEGLPNDPDILEEIGMVRRRQGLSDIAIDKFKQAFKLDPRSPLRASTIADTYFWTRQYGEAETYYNRALSLAPHLGYCYAQKARLLVMRDGDVESARRLLHDASKLVQPIPWFNHTSAWVDACAGDYQAALAKLTNDEDYFSPGAHYYNRAALYGLLGNPKMAAAYYDSARVMLEDAVASVPQDARYRIGLAVAYAGLGRKDDAKRERELALTLAPISENASFNPSIAVTAARISVMVGEYESAVDQLQRLLSIPARVSVPALKVDPTWAPLRELTSFREMTG